MWNVYETKVSEYVKKVLLLKYVNKVIAAIML